MPSVLYLQQVQSNTAVDDVSHEKRTHSIKLYPEIKVAWPTCQKIQYEGEHNSFSSNSLRSAIFQQTPNDSYVRESYDNPRTFPCFRDYDRDTSCQQQTNTPVLLVSKNNASQPSLHANCHSHSTVQQTAKKHCRYNHMFESKVEELKEYIEENGHMKVSHKENKPLHTWIKNVKRSFQHKKHKGYQHVSDIQLDQKRMEMLKCINFDFGRHLKPFDLVVEELQEYIKKNGHMNVTSKENKQLKSWINGVRSSRKSIQQGKRPRIHLSQERIKKLEDINFDFGPESKRERAMECGWQKRGCSAILAETKDDTFRAPKIPRHENESINTRQKMPPTNGTTCSPPSHLSFQSFESSVEEREMYYVEKNDFAEQCEEEHERIEIEGDLIPTWLLVGDDENHDHDQEATSTTNEDHAFR